MTSVKVSDCIFVCVCVCVTVLVPCFQMRDLSAKCLYSTASSSIENLYVQCCVSSSSRRLPPTSHHNWKEVGGRVLPAGFLPSHRLPVDVQAHKHLPLLVPPLGWRVRIVAVLLDPLLQGAVDAELPLGKTSIRFQCCNPPTCEVRAKHRAFSCANPLWSLTVSCLSYYSLICITCFALCACAENQGCTLEIAQLCRWFMCAPRFSCDSELSRQLEK